MSNKNEARQRRARKTRAKIADQKAVRLAIHRTNQHIYAQVISACGGKILASASTVEADIRKDVGNGGNTAAAAAALPPLPMVLRTSASSVEALASTLPPSAEITWA